jgi:hypothetical protein
MKNGVTVSILRFLACFMNNTALDCEPSNRLMFVYIDQALAKNILGSPASPLPIAAVSDSPKRDIECVLVIVDLRYPMHQTPEGIFKSAPF